MTVPISSLTIPRLLIFLTGFAHLDVVDASLAIAKLFNIVEVKVEIRGSSFHQIIQWAQIAIIMTPWHLQNFFIVNELDVSLFTHISLNADHELNSER